MHTTVRVSEAECKDGGESYAADGASRQVSSLLSVLHCIQLSMVSRKRKLHANLPTITTSSFAR